MNHTHICLLVLVVFLTGCKEDSPVSYPLVLLPPQMEGRWNGTASWIYLPMTLSQDGSQISGKGTISGSGPTLNVTVTGAVYFPSVRIIVAIPGYEGISIGGKFVTQTRIEGLVNGSGFTNNPIVILKQ